MEVGSVKELSRFRYEKAMSNLQLAHSLYNDGQYAFALNRAYYALFDGMRAVNALDGFDSSKHSGVISHFNMTYVKTAQFPATTSTVIKQASRLREKSDYEDFYVPDKEETAETIANVENFLCNVKAFLCMRL